MKFPFVKILIQMLRLCYLWRNTQRKFADTTGTVLSAGSLEMLKHNYIFSNKIYGNNLIKQQSETVMVWNYQNAGCSLKK